MLCCGKKENQGTCFNKCSGEKKSTAEAVANVICFVYDQIPAKFNLIMWLKENQGITKVCRTHCLKKPQTSASNVMTINLIVVEIL